MVIVLIAYLAQENKDQTYRIYVIILSGGESDHVPHSQKAHNGAEQGSFIQNIGKNS